MVRLSLLLLILSFWACQSETAGQRSAPPAQQQPTSAEGTTLARIATPSGYHRQPVGEGSFAQYLRNIPLHPPGANVHYYDGSVKPHNVHEAVIKMDVGSKDLQQCADAIMRLRAEYLLQKGRPEDIHFNFTNGFRADYSKWKDGFRISVNGSKASWVKRTGEDGSYDNFRKYLEMVYNYAGTLSLSRELKAINYIDMQPGDVLIQGGSPGHAVIVMDMATGDGGKKLYLLAQSYMPAQEIHVLKNFSNPDLSPWYELHERQSQILTPEWTFTSSNLKRFTQP